MSSSNANTDFKGVFPTIYNIKQNETKNESLWDPTGINPLSDKYCYLLAVGWSASIQPMYVMFTLYHSTFLTKMPCRKKTNAVLIFTFYQLSYNISGKINEYKIISIDI